MFLVVSYFMTVDIHRFALMWLVHSRNRFFRVGPNISEKFAPGRGGGGGGNQVSAERSLKSLRMKLIERFM